MTATWFALRPAVARLDFTHNKTRIARRLDSFAVLARPRPALMSQSPRLDAFLRSPELARYRHQLALWVTRDSVDEGALWRASVALCQAAREAAVPPEELVVALRTSDSARALLFATDSRSRLEQEREHRRIRGINLLLQACFGDTAIDRRP